MIAMGVSLAKLFLFLISLPRERRVVFEKSICNLPDTIPSSRHLLRAGSSELNDSNNLFGLWQNALNFPLRIKQFL